MMNLKNSIYKLSFAAMISMMAMNATEIQAQGVVPAQKGEKAFTLEDLNFGGNNYRNMVAKNRWCTWWGNELIHQDIEACYLVNKTTGKETKLFGINDINQWIAPTKDIKVRALYNAQCCAQEAGCRHSGKARDEPGGDSIEGWQRLYRCLVSLGRGVVEA